MESFNIRHFYNVLGKKIVFVFLAVLLALPASGQGLNKPFYDYSRTIHFGFLIGTNYSRFKYDFSPAWYAQDSFLEVSSVGYPGISLGAVANLHIGSTRSYLREHFDLRMTPTLVLSTRRFQYLHPNTLVEEKEVESALLEAPLLLKFKSDRIQNIRFYAIGGAKFSFDLASEASAARNPADPRVAIYPVNLAYEYGVGLDMYFPYFKFSPEVKLSRGINNILVPDPAAYSNIFSRLRSNFIYFSFYFEG